MIVLVDKPLRHPQAVVNVSSGLRELPPLAHHLGIIPLMRLATNQL